MQFLTSRGAWLAKAQALAARIKKRRGNTKIDVDALFDFARDDLQDRS